MRARPSFARCSAMSTSLPTRCDPSPWSTLRSCRSRFPIRSGSSCKSCEGNKEGKPAPGRSTSLIESLKIALQYFPALFGIEIDLDFSTDPAKAFLALAEIGKEMANPKTLEQLSGKDIDAFELAGTAWYHAQVSEIFRHCAEQIPEASPIPPTPAQPEYQHVDRSGDDGASSLRNPDHVKKAFEILKGDTSRAMGVSTKMAARTTCKRRTASSGCETSCGRSFPRLTS